MPYKPGQSIALTQLTKAVATGIPTDATGTPTAVMRKNGVADATPTLTVTKPATGTYKIVGTIPSTYAKNDHVEVLFSGTLGGNAFAEVIDLGLLDGVSASPMNSETNTTYGPNVEGHKV